MAAHFLCPKCDQLSDDSAWEESGDYSSCPSCGSWSLSVDVEAVSIWSCYSCNVANPDEVDECDLCGLSKDASDYLSGEA
jgi:hypothetical protein